MARNTAEWTAESGRDAGKVFFITEMPPRKRALLIAKVLLAIGDKMPTEVTSYGIDGVIDWAKSMGIQALLSIDPEIMLNHADELLTGVKIKNESGDFEPLTEDSIDETGTLLSLYMQVYAVNVFF